MKKSFFCILAILAISLSTVQAGSWSANITSRNGEGFKMDQKDKTYIGIYSTYFLSADAYISNLSSAISYADAWATIWYPGHVLQIIAATPASELAPNGYLYNGWYINTASVQNITASYIQVCAYACSVEASVTASANAYISW